MKIKSIVIILMFSICAFSMTKEERKELFKNATQEFKNSGIEKRIPHVGELMPTTPKGRPLRIFSKR